jgi:hypothetical protein
MIRRREHGLITYGAFTVKHEAISYWEDHLDSDPAYCLVRTTDGPVYDDGNYSFKESHVDWPK